MSVRAILWQGPVLWHSCCFPWKFAKVEQEHLDSTSEIFFCSSLMASTKRSNPALKSCCSLLQLLWPQLYLLCFWKSSQVQTFTLLSTRVAPRWHPELSGTIRSPLDCPAFFLQVVTNLAFLHSSARQQLVGDSPVLTGCPLPSSFCQHFSLSSALAFY